MNSIVVEHGNVDEVREMQRRRRLDDAAISLSLDSAERGSVWLARDDATTIGVLVARDTSDERYIGDWFVEPSYRGAGIGSRLLQAVTESCRDLTLSAMADPSGFDGLSLLARSAIVLRQPILRVAGEIPKEEVLAKMAAGDYRFNVEPIDAETHGHLLDELDRNTRGTTRSADHASFTLSASGNVFFLGGECVGYAYVWPDGRIGPIACASEAYLVQIFAYATVTLQRTYAGSWCTGLIPGSNRRVARAALRAGLQITKTLLFSSNAEVPGMSNYVGYHEVLF